jgi:hypothetical protein
MKYIITIPALLLSLIMLYCLPAVHARAKPLMVSANMAGMAIETSVDSDLARDIILAGRDLDPDLLPPELAALLPCNSRANIPTTESLAKISRDYSTDTATALLIRCLARNPTIEQSQALFLAELEQARAQAGTHTRELAASLAQQSSEYSVLVVPGWGYRSSSEVTGADLSRPREIISDLGFDTQLLEIPSYGSVETSANYVIDELLEHLQGDRKIILVSASSGGPIVAQVLGDDRIARHPKMVGWLNICGVMNGSPVIDKFLGWPGTWFLRLVSLFEGWEYEDLLSLSRSRSTPRYANFQPPEQMTVLNYIGIPFSGQVSSLGKRFYQLLKKQGPNDGLTLITEALVPGYTIMALGQDHFVASDTEIDLKTAALLPVMLKLIEESQQARLKIASRYAQPE